MSGGKKVPTLLHAQRSTLHLSKMLSLSYIPDGGGEIGLEDESDASGVSGRGNSSKQRTEEDMVMPEDAEHARTPKHLPSVTDLFGPEVASPVAALRAVHQTHVASSHEQKN